MGLWQLFEFHQRNREDGKSLVNFVNHYGEKEVSIVELGRYLEEQFDYKWEEVELDEWISKTGEAFLKPMFGIVISEIWGSDRDSAEDFVERVDEIGYLF